MPPGLRGVGVKGTRAQVREWWDQNSVALFFSYYFQSDWAWRKCYWGVSIKLLILYRTTKKARHRLSGFLGAITVPWHWVLGWNLACIRTSLNIEIMNFKHLGFRGERAYGEGHSANTWKGSLGGRQRPLLSSWVPQLHFIWSHSVSIDPGMFCLRLFI